MRKLDNKGFAITGILYTLFILFILLMFSILNGLQSKKQMLERSTVKLEESFKSKDVTNDSNIGIEKALTEGKALTTGKYLFEINTNNIPIEGLNKTNGLITSSSGKMQYSIDENKNITVTALSTINNDGYGELEGIQVYLQEGKTYHFSCETTGIWASTEGDNTSDTVEVYIYPSSRGATKEDWICMNSTSCNTNQYQKILNTTSGGYYNIRLDVNQKGKTYIFKNLTITSDDGTAPAFTYLSKGDSLAKAQIEFIPNDWNEYKNNYDFKLTKIESFESGE
ncbi:MAG: hypothetical protein PUD25_06965 [Bacilli bacterium]|nr:hypothetical protein [Bacilli bacterium]